MTTLDTALAPAAGRCRAAGLRAHRAGGSARTAAHACRMARLGAGTSVLEPAEHGADDPDRRRARADRAAAGRLPLHRCDLERHRPRSLPRDAGAARGRRLLGLHPRTLRLHDLRILPDRRALAGRPVLRAPGVRDGVAPLARRAAARPRLRVLFRRAAGRQLRAAARRPGARTAGGGHLAVGRHAGDHRGGGGRHRRLAPDRDHCSRSGGAPTCPRSGCCRPSTSSSCAACR